MQQPNDFIQRYLEDAIAAEKSFETQLQTFAKEGDQPEAHQLFQQHAIETRQQYDMLTARLNALGGSTSTMKSFLAHVFGVAPKTAQIGHDEAERVTQNLMMAYAVENSEVAMYEAMAVAAAEAGDFETEQLARRIQKQEQATADKVFAMLPIMARRSYEKLAGSTATMTGSGAAS